MKKKPKILKVVTALDCCVGCGTVCWFEFVHPAYYVKGTLLCKACIKKWEDKHLPKEDSCHS